jgi:hypothetical protein
LDDRLDVLDRHDAALPVEVDRNQVDPAVGWELRVILGILIGSLEKPPRLARAYRLRSRTHGVAAPCLHLNEGSNTAPHSDEIDLALWQPDTAGQHAVAMRFQVRSGNTLTEVTEGPAGGHRISRNDTHVVLGCISAVSAAWQARTRLTAHFT